MQIHSEFRAFVEEELLPGLKIEADYFWDGVEAIVEDLSPENERLLKVRAQLQSRIDTFYQDQGNRQSDVQSSRNFLQEIGYLIEQGEPFEIQTQNVDPEIAKIAGPQLVVPVNNARFALNAANARWGSLYDALYGTDVIPGERSGAYDPDRGTEVIRYGAGFLDQAVPLANGSHAVVTKYELVTKNGSKTLLITLDNGEQTTLADPTGFAGYSKEGSTRYILLKNNGLHIVISFNPDHPIAVQSASGMVDIELESAVSTIQDCEDSVAAVDAPDKVAVYRNWLGLMKGDLEASFRKGKGIVVRKLNPDREFFRPDGNRLTLAGRSLMLVRNVGHLMTTDAIRIKDGLPVYEGILDAIITASCALYDLRGLSNYQNSRAGSIYVVKPKMHGPEEVAFTDRLFSRVEDLLELDRYTIKIGVMDEERRTTVNLSECIRAVKHRLVFINTGFLDRTGDEIHTHMNAGPVLPKDKIKEAVWIDAYENRNVDIGIRCGLPGKAQIGKGMWAMPDEMKAMVDSKAAHPQAGANCAWVPSPTAATLHAMHYHEVNVASRQVELARREPASLDDILTPPLGDADEWTEELIQNELDNNAQGILGYVVRWIDQGIGCSKVPDISDTGLMEDRATLRISSQHIANWLHHGVCSEEQVLETFKRMARIVDEQNSGDALYQNMAPDYDQSIAFKAACELALKGRGQPNGYTEPLLHHYRGLRKQQLGG
jgi:malate synthase